MDAFKLYISTSMTDQIVTYTNVEIKLKREKYANDNKTTVKPTSTNEFQTLLGLLCMSAAMKNNHLNSKEYFDYTFSGTLYISVMNRNCLYFLLNFLRFDDKSTRSARKLLDKLAPTRDIWNQFIKACRINYIPGSYVTTDEELLGFRGRCPFRMYLPSKPNKYGMKIIVL
ncbi:uncharacterized protein LOC142317775 [Lycorma delicatula]|uniref:uncharacterized protein LOC142317775 n=1 Tax=Lycorma delicatula TaxID=130591 RepID=UPI003F517560